MMMHGTGQNCVVTRGLRETRLAQCARVALKGHHVAYVVPDRASVRVARDLCARLVQPCAVQVGRLYYGTAIVWFVVAKRADYQTRTWPGFVVLDPDIGWRGDPGLQRAMRDVRDLVNLRFPEGEFERLAGETS
ncbi:hypothetical protein [Roseobacter sp. TSBP12]|uniref:hypothetical protein n=1 Tax=Roseobacter sp. TSBP12 TaxID=1236613 RepID=UPI00186A9637|nr:hypothetical protein [Roseobacter sp. TSBP12]KAB6714315.1 hypothetical protein C8029_21485 [Roseobacter sp. TSBP12]